MEPALGLALHAGQLPDDPLRLEEQHRVPAAQHAPRGPRLPRVRCDGYAALDSGQQCALPALIAHTLPAHPHHSTPRPCSSAVARTCSPTNGSRSVASSSVSRHLRADQRTPRRPGPSLTTLRTTPASRSRPTCRRPMRRKIICSRAASWARSPSYPTVRLDLSLDRVSCAHPPLQVGCFCPRASPTAPLATAIPHGRSAKRLGKARSTLPPTSTPRQRPARAGRAQCRTRPSAVSITPSPRYWPTARS